MKKTVIFITLILALIMCMASCDSLPFLNSNSEHAHEFSEWSISKNPTCTEDGVKVRYCSCGEKQSEIVVALGHTPAEATIEDKVEATYETYGSYNEVVRCLICNEKLSQTAHTIPMLKHTPASAVEENRIPATCYSEGSYEMVIYCTECGVKLESTKHTISMIEHTPASAIE